MFEEALEPQNEDWYRILEVSLDATPHDIRQSYLRLKAAFSKDSIALYSLMEMGDTGDILNQLEKAYEVLSDPQKRKEYDQEIKRSEEDPFQAPSTPRRQIVSVEQVPPMEDQLSEEDLLNVPSVEIPGASHPPKREETPFSDPLPAPAPVAKKSEDLDGRIQMESEWRGDTIRQFREDLGVSIEEMVEFTKISKKYIKAIESDDYEDLPASVFLRGFLIQIGRKLRLPSEKLAAAYISRVRQERPDHD